MNFDGVAASVKAPLGETFSVFGTAGAFPIFNTSLNFSSRDAGAFESKDRYLFGGQIGFEFSPSDSIRGRLAAGYFQFDGVQGEFSAPCRWAQEIGRASCRERVCQSVWISVVSGYFKRK